LSIEFIGDNIGVTLPTVQFIRENSFSGT